MLKQQYRLKKKYQFNYTYKSGQTQGAKHLLICYTKSKNKCVKIGLSVTKKVGKAFMRNRIKRRLRAALSPNLERIKPNFNLIVIARSNITDATFAEVEKDLNFCLTKAGLWRD